MAGSGAQGLRELRGTLRRGAMDIGDFVSADGPSALLDVISEVIAKPCAACGAALSLRRPVAALWHAAP